MMCGMGTYWYPNGESYTGMFKDDKRHGWGKYTYNSGDTEEGEWVNYYKEGEHIYTYSKTGKQEKRLYKHGEKKGGCPIQ